MGMGIHMEHRRRHGHMGMGMGMVAGLMDVFGAAAFVAGTACYNRYLSRWSYRRILSAAGLQWRHPSRAAAAHGRAQPPCGPRKRRLGRAEALQRSRRAALSQSGLETSSLLAEPTGAPSSSY